MLALAYGGAVIAAGLNASSSVLQRLATEKPEARRLFSKSFFLEIVKTKLFILGFIAQTIGFIAQAIALANGPLIIVEPLLTSDLVFLLLIIHWRLKINIRLRDWLSVGLIALGLGGLFSAMNPKSGNLLNYHAFPWIMLVSLLGTIIIILAIIIRKLKSPLLRAVLASIAAGGAFALNAAFTKLALNLYRSHGVIAVIDQWPLYALIVSGAISIYLMLNAFASGPLGVSQPVMEVTEPTIAVLIGLFIFGDSYSTSISSLAFGSVCIIILISGIALLGNSPRIHQAGEQGY